MNLLEAASIKRHWPTSGNLVPGTNCFEKIPAEWSRPRLSICEGMTGAFVAKLVNELLENPDVNVCAVSPATIASDESSQLMAVTVICQDRIKPEAAQVACPECAGMGAFPPGCFNPGAPALPCDRCKGCGEIAADELDRELDPGPNV